jgi:hypothetical protein
MNVLCQEQTYPESGVSSSFTITRNPRDTFVFICKKFICKLCYSIEERSNF